MCDMQPAPARARVSRVPLGYHTSPECVPVCGSVQVSVKLLSVPAHTHTHTHTLTPSCPFVCTQGPFQWALWVNTSKNPRLKAVEMAALRMVVEVPKQIALANIAMRVQIREKVRTYTCTRAHGCEAQACLKAAATRCATLALKSEDQKVHACACVCHPATAPSRTPCMHSLRPGHKSQDCRHALELWSCKHEALFPYEPSAQLV